MAFAELLGQKAEMHALEARLGDDSVPEGEHESMLVRYAELQERFRRDDGYSIDLRIATVLRGLGFSQDDLAKPTETFSGGWQMRIALAKLLLGRPGLLLLDEPTNHLDLDARNWLEEYLSTYPHAVILVSHDRYFLDAVVTRITDLNLRTLTDYVGNYSKYVEQRDAMLERLRQAKRDQDEEVARVKMFIDRFRYQATKAAQVQSRIKMLEKVVPIEVPPERKRVRFTFPTAPKSGRTVLELKGVRKAYGATRVFEGIDLLIERGDRVALIGPNGAGKSTLMRILSGVEAPDAGTRTEGHQVVMQYFAQDEATRLEPTLTVYETLEAGSPVQMVPAIRTILGGFLFGGDDIYKKAGVLSGGERTRLAVARMLLRPANTLLLDEPTNHLDMDSKDVLLDALEDFGGTLILVSHDRYFIDKLATKVIDVGGGAAQRLSGRLRGIPLEPRQARGGSRGEGAPAKAGARQGRAAGEGRARRREGRAAAGAASAGRSHAGRARRRRPRQAGRRTRRPQAAGSRGAAAQARARGGRRADRDARSHHRRAGSDDEDARGDDERARLLREPRHLEADHRSAPGADVGARRPDAPLGRAAAGARSRRSLTEPRPGLRPAASRPLPGLRPASSRPLARLARPPPGFSRPLPGVGPGSRPGSAPGLGRARRAKTYYNSVIH